MVFTLQIVYSMKATNAERERLYLHNNITKIWPTNNWFLVLVRWRDLFILFFRQYGGSVDLNPLYLMVSTAADSLCNYGGQ